MQKNRAINLLRLVSKGQSFSILAYFNDADQQLGALVTKGSEETEYQKPGSYADFVYALENAGVKLKKGSVFVQLIGVTANKFLQAAELEKV